jgi:hypothetical protein
MSTVKRIASNQLDHIKAALLPLREAVVNQQPEFAVNGSVFKTPAAQAFTVQNITEWADRNQPYIGKKNDNAARAAAGCVHYGEIDVAITALGAIAITL